MADRMEAAGRPTIFTIGHGTRSTDELAAILRGAGVRRLIDVRRFPASRRSPWLAREPLAVALPAFGIAYEWWGETLGGRRSRTQRPSRHAALEERAFQGYAEHMETEPFQRALARLEEEARAGDALALMCAESLWWRCHRRLIADALTLRGIAVVHLLDARRSEPHRLHPALRADESGRAVYDIAARAGLRYNG